MPLRLLAVTFDAHDPAVAAEFWAGMLGRAVIDDARGPLLPGSETQVGLRFSHTAAEKAGPNRVHLHLTSATPADQQEIVTAALERGAAHIDIGQRPEEGHIVLADTDGNEFCVIEAGNKFLAGCGFLGEVACTGTRDVGLFWAQALGWPLVWDRDQETAVQSPHGGTKLAWGGTPPIAGPSHDRHRFDLVAEGDPTTEVDRLVSLGARRIGGDDGSVALADPDGIVFSLSQD
ncbi:VOC family protein [Occultella aeris]|uniref:Glyoxalase-like domain protein n=1 Tax=Occultella aeris TaxID=2761496 RepID=A0A7M4DFU6_9MICO|nr:VOC family protein [Occultella aeris]VZO35789.1 Glyoxalase-like domain protein [Occultella aeris]